MNFKIKTFLGLERGNHVIAIISGTVAFQEIKHIFWKVADETRPLLDCKVLVDFQEVALEILPSDVAQLVKSIDRETWPRNNKVALVAAQKSEQYGQLAMLSEEFRKQDFDVGVFYSSKEAVSWLSDIR